MSHNGYNDHGRNIVVLLVCGLPGCGKTTFAEQLVELITEATDPSFEQPECHHIEYDKIQQRIFSGQPASGSVADLNDSSLEAWRNSRIEALEELDNVLRRIEAQSRPKHTLVIMDDNFHLRSMRKQVFHVCQNHKQKLVEMKSNSLSAANYANNEIFFATIWIETPYDICFSQNASRGARARVSEETIRKIHETSEKPVEGNPAWEANVLSLSHLARETDSLVKKAIHFVRSLLGGRGQAVPQHVPPHLEQERIEKERAATKANVGHQIDQLSRKWVKAVGQIRPGEAKTANKVRKDILLQRNDGNDATSLVRLFLDRLFEECSSVWTSEEKDLLMQELHDYK